MPLEPDVRAAPPAACSFVQFAHSPKTSTTWAAAVKPFSAAMRFAHASTSSAAISTVSPQLRQMRWWWWPVVEHAR